MARFYLNILKDGHFEPDPTGEEFSDLAAAREEALASAKEILAGALKSPHPELIDCFVITDDEGRELDTVPLKDALPKGLC